MNNLNQKEKSYDVVICGAGTVGLTVANLLNSLGLKICLIDQNSEINQDFNAIGINNECLKAWKISGIYDKIQKYIGFNNDGDLMMKYLDCQKNELFSLYQSYDNENYPIGVVFLQNEIDRALFDNISQKIDIKMNEKVQKINENNDYISIKTDKGRYKTKYLIGSDGKYSIIRDFINSKMNFLSESKDQWLILNILRKEACQKEYVEVFCGERSVVSCMLPENWHRIEMTLKKDEFDIINDDFKIKKILNQYVDLGEYEIKRKFKIKFKTGIVDKYFHNNIVLCGDAAHVTSPFAASGLVSGIDDCVEIYLLFKKNKNKVNFRIYQKNRYRKQLKKLKLAIRMEKVMRHGNFLKYIFKITFKILRYFSFTKNFFSIR